MGFLFSLLVIIKYEQVVKLRVFLAQYFVSKNLKFKFILSTSSNKKQLNIYIFLKLYSVSDYFY